MWMGVACKMALLPISMTLPGLPFDFDFIDWGL
jgi:hypothetical protein